MYMVSKKCPYEGGGDIKFKKILTRVATMILEKCQKKFQGRMAHDFLKMKGADKPPPPCRANFKPARNFYSYVDPDST